MKLGTFLTKTWRGAVVALAVAMILGLVPMPTVGQGNPPPPMECRTDYPSDTGCKDNTGECHWWFRNYQIWVSCSRKCCYLYGELYSETWQISSSCECFNTGQCCFPWFSRNCAETADVIKQQQGCPLQQPQ